MSPRRGSTPRLTDWLIVSYNVTLTLGAKLFACPGRPHASVRSWSGTQPWTSLYFVVYSKDRHWQHLIICVISNYLDQNTWLFYAFQTTLVKYLHITFSNLKVVISGDVSVMVVQETVYGIRCACKLRNYSHYAVSVAEHHGPGRGTPVFHRTQLSGECSQCSKS